MIDDAHAASRGHPQRHRKSERVEERQHPQDAVAAAQHERLRDLIDIRGEIVMGEHHPFGISRAPAGKNNGGEIVELGRRALARARVPEDALEIARPSRARRFFR